MVQQQKPFDTVNLIEKQSDVCFLECLLLFSNLISSALGFISLNLGTIIESFELLLEQVELLDRHRGDFRELGVL